MVKAIAAVVVLLLPHLGCSFQPALRSAVLVQSPTPSSTRLITTTEATVTAGDWYGDAENANGDRLFEPIGRGIIRDYKARLPLMVSDIKDGLNVQCLAATMFLFFACLAPAIGFGSLFNVATDGAIGVMEMVSSTAFCGIAYALTSAQPLTIIGSTGPVLAFVATVYQLAVSLNLPFLPLYAWTGLWTSGILFASAITSGSNLVKYLTRFTDEIFSTLISAIFVVEAFSDVAGTFSNPASTFTKALLTAAFATTTYTMAGALKGLRKSSFFTRRIRNTISNFGPAIGVVSATLLARWARISQGAAVAGLPSLAMPTTFATTSGRPWLVPLLDLPMWARWGAFLPALMATVLLFLDQNITVRLVNNPRWKMEKGRRKGNVLDGMHADMMVVSILTAIQSVLGIPWLVAATVRSLSHVGALSKYDSNGKVVGTIEQRVTGVAIHSLIACCVLFSKPRQLLTNVPLSVLMGLFLYLGTSSLPGNEMWERIVGLIKDPTVAPKERWTDKVPRNTVNLFTGIQVACLAATFWLKESKIGVLFPIVIALLAPIRFGLEKSGIVKKEYMDVLDEE
ncbi:Electroneutral sodium bicarbonate exchanger 1 [Seminavis robusta]|uniref:Electroneutral sodium bicarbonate exchanger 1 n=1 Tax=Seminavis robusta TaxID=568900 RepID=A0A9N8EVD9_9STRA|nr:Electroneutral sodium bicarbonate exchanger 1 [Seminavis robusta]|eukprot:Sro1990_g309730.1 Electroneutral sodium bicarbonate exchanger 1 (569) ;mRNA; r:11775-13725